MKKDIVIKSYFFICGLTANVVAVVMSIIWSLNKLSPEDPSVPTPSAELAVKMYVAFTVLLTISYVVMKRWPREVHR